MNRIFFFSLSLFFFTSVSGCAHDYVTGKSSYNWFKMQDEISMGKEVLHSQVAAFEAKNVPLDSHADPKSLEKIRQIVIRISKVSHMPQLPYEVHLADAPIVNAWAAPGGKIMVYTGLWDSEKGLVRKENESEIAAVLAHEIAHATARHVTESLSKNMTIMMAGSVASGAIAAAGSAQGSNLFGKFFSTGYNVYAPSYSRKNESEADKIGLFYMAKAGYDPRAAIEVWKRASQKRGDDSSIFASHPASGERAKNLEKYLPLALEIYRHPEKPYPDFLQPKQKFKSSEKKDSKS